MKRRTFLAGGVAGLGVTAGRGRPLRADDGASGCLPRTRVTSVDALADHAPVHFTYPVQEHGCLLVKLGAPAEGGVGDDGDIVAFSEICPHMGCSLGGQISRERPGLLGPCPCHFSVFDLRRAGALMQGQATQPLAQIALEIEDGDIFAVGVRGRLFGFPSVGEGNQ